MKGAARKTEARNATFMYSMNGSVSSRKTGRLAPRRGRTGTRKKSRIRRAYESVSANAVPTARTHHQSRFRSSSRCSRNDIVGSSAPLVVRRPGIVAPGHLARPFRGGGRQSSGSGWIGSRHLRVERLLEVGGGLAEFGEAPADGAPQLRELARSKDQ